MAINDFSPIIQLMATLSIAFVAIEYVKSFTSQLCERVFRFKDFIAQSFKECKNSLADMETLDSIKPIDINGNNTFDIIEEAKRERESLIKKIDSIKSEKDEELICVCQVKSMSALCLMIFVSGVLLLLLGGFEKNSVDFVKAFGGCFTLSVIFYLLLGWSFGEKSKPFLGFLDFPSLRHTLIAFVVLCAISIIGAVVFNYFYKIIDFCLLWNFMLPLYILFICLNYLVFVIKIRNKAQRFRSDIINDKEFIKKECCQSKLKVDDLVATNRVSTRMMAD